MVQSELRGRRVSRCLAVVGGLALAGCSADSAQFGIGGVASYSAANVVLTTGYNEDRIDPTHYRVRVNGTEQTPKGRVERIALTRAAEIGVENKLAYFKITETRHGAACSARKPGYKSADAGPVRYPTVVLDVEYGQVAADASWQEAATTHSRLRAELDGESVGPEAKAAAAAEIRERCGGR